MGSPAARIRSVYAAIWMSGFIIGHSGYHDAAGLENELLTELQNKRKGRKLYAICKNDCKGGESRSDSGCQ